MSGKCLKGVQYVSGVRKVFEGTWNENLHPIFTGRKGLICLEGVWKVFGRCQEGVWKVSGGCLEGIWKMFGRCLDGDWRVSVGSKLGWERSILDWSKWDKLGQVKSGHVKSGWI